jgi:hypothetical protein
MSLFDGVRIESIDGWNFDGLVGDWNSSSVALAKRQRDRLSQSGDPLFNDLVEILGNENSQDAWHIRTAEVHDLLAYVTMDYKLLHAVKHGSKQLDRLRLKTWILSPQELGVRLKMSRVPPDLLSHTDASFPVRAESHWPQERRRSGKRPIFKDALKRE